MKLTINDHQITGGAVVRGTIWVDVNPILESPVGLRHPYVATMPTTDEVRLTFATDDGELEALVEDLLRQKYGQHIEVPELEVINVHQGDEESLPQVTFRFAVVI